MNLYSKLTLACIALVTCAFITSVPTDNPIETFGKCVLDLMAVAALAGSFSGGFGVKDALLKQTVALPAAASGTVNTAAGIDTMHSSISDFQARAELLITAPPLTVGQLPNAATMTCNIIASPNANMSAPVVVASGVLVQTGAAGAGAVTSTARYRLATNIGVFGRYVGLQVVSGSTATNSSAVSASVELVF